MLKEELNNLFMASSSGKVQRRAQLTIQQVGITVTLLQKQLGGLHLPIPVKESRLLKEKSMNIQIYSSTLF